MFFLQQNQKKRAEWVLPRGRGQGKGVVNVKTIKYN
jgi:hypothetical protein